MTYGASSSEHFPSLHILLPACAHPSNTPCPLPPQAPPPRPAQLPRAPSLHSHLNSDVTSLASSPLKDTVPLTQHHNLHFKFIALNKLIYLFGHMVIACLSQLETKFLEDRRSVSLACSIPIWTLTKTTCQSQSHSGCKRILDPEPWTKV